jgi:hypothetical protein
LEDAVKRVRSGLIVVVALMVWAARGYAAPMSAAVSGVVRDVHGTPQMGALVELLGADATTVASALTDDHGRYILPSLSPGKYELRATAAFFVPVTKANLSLNAGAQAIINLTMSTLFEAGNWLPAERRAPDEPLDDWKWTLRSTASRPLLRLTDEDGQIVSTSASEIHHAATQAQLSVINGDGAFGDGGVHQVLTMDRVIESGDGSIFRADLGDPQSPLTVTPSLDVMAGYQRQLPFNGRTRLMTSYASHPELIANGVPGFELLRIASAEELSLGDAVMIDAGTLMEAERLEATRLMTEPYVRITVKPGADYAVEYRYASGRSLQCAEDMDRLKAQASVLTDQAGRPLSDKGAHQEVVVSRKLGDDDAVSVAVYHDTFLNGVLEGSGAVDGATMQSAPVVADPTTLMFRLATSGYTARGASVKVTHKITPALDLTAEYDLGTALRAAEMEMTIGQLQTEASTASAASVSLRGKILRTGTAVNAEYRWQPVSTLTQVDAYDASPEEAYLSFALRQRLWGGRFLPHGVDAVVEATNLLEQGYQPVLAPDGRTLFLAQVPRAIQAGLAFNF